QPAAAKSVTKPFGPARKPSLPWAIAAAAVALLVLVGALVLRRPPPPAPPAPIPAAPAVQPMPEAFTAVFDSFPGGAEVCDGDPRAGWPRMRLSLRNVGLDPSRKKFGIGRGGFLRWEVMRGQSREPVRVQATLAADPEKREKEKPIEPPPARKIRKQQ